MYVRACKVHVHVKVWLSDARVCVLLRVRLPQNAPEMISKGLNSKIFLGGHAPRPPLAARFARYIIIYELAM